MPIHEGSGRAGTILHQLLGRATIGFGTLVTAIAMASCATQAPQAAQSRDSVFTERQRTAMAMFAERCKTSGEFIRKIVTGVEGIVLQRLRTGQLNYGNQFAFDDPYGSDFFGEAYIRSFLREGEAAGPGSSPLPQRAYRYVVVNDLGAGISYRYTGKVQDVIRTASVMGGGDGKSTYVTREFVLTRAAVTDDNTEYGVTFEDISTREEREHWIAGSSLRVVDLRLR